MFKKKTGQKVIFAPKITLRVEHSDPAQNSFFPADFLSARLQCSKLLWNCAKIKAVYPRARGERGLDVAQTFGLNCSMTHSPSVSRFQEKEKRGEMITINDNIK